MPKITGPNHHSFLPLLVLSLPPPTPIPLPTQPNQQHMRLWPAIAQVHPTQMLSVRDGRRVNSSSVKPVVWDELIHTHINTQNPANWFRILQHPPKREGEILSQPLLSTWSLPPSMRFSQQQSHFQMWICLKILQGLFTQNKRMAGTKSWKSKLQASADWW